MLSFYPVYPAHPVVTLFLSYHVLSTGQKLEDKELKQDGQDKQDEEKIPS